MNVGKDCTYWNEKGLYQDFVNMLEPRLPEIGYTNNVYVNIFIAMSHLYYDAYNNGGCNIEDCYMGDFRKHVVLYLGDKVDVDAFIFGNDTKIEASMNAAIFFIKDRNLEFPLYSCWINHQDQAISMVEPFGDINEKPCWFRITYGDIDDLRSFARGYRDLTERFKQRSPENKKSALDDIIQSCELVNRGTAAGNNRDCSEKSVWDGEREER